MKRFRGHRNVVTCLDICHNNALSSNDYAVVSGSEDKTVRIWDIKTGKASKCLSNCKHINEAIGSVAMYDKMVYCSSGNSLSVFDIRMETIILTQATIHVQNICDDDINSIVISQNGKYLSIADDDGFVSIYDRETLDPKITLNNVHSSIVGSVAFRPSNNDVNIVHEIFTGGFVCLLCSWDYVKSRYPFSSSHDGDYVACGLGSGSVINRLLLA